MEVLMIRSVEMIQSIERIDRSVRMNDVEQNGQSESVSRIDQFHQILRCTCQLRRQAHSSKKVGSMRLTVSTRRSEETRNLIPETGVISVLHDSPTLTVSVRARERVYDEIHMS